jgi:putative ABC transport system substrate-binding protein
MRRREFIALLSGAAAWPVAAGAQQPERMRRVGVLMAYENGPLAQSYLTAFRQAFQEKGWAEGRNISIDERWSGGDADRLQVYAAAPGLIRPLGTRG